MMLRLLLPLLSFSLLCCSDVFGADGSVDSPADASREIHQYLRDRVIQLNKAEPCVVATKEEWNDRRATLRRQLEEMLGLMPMPARTDLEPVVTGSIERDGVVVEKLHFQSSPGLYVTANFYRPEEVEGKLPTILYLCGHGRVAKNGVSFGNKVHYQHHGAWFAQHGYCCLTIDTLQLGEIEGLHHGTHREGMWWWIARGYTPAGIEAWNSIRALDYLETRPEVDMARIGVTGRSGGGAYSWWVAALDDRPACIAPVAGITDLENHVVDGCIKGHCDCMFMVNRYGWDFATLASLAAPRPLLLGNTDKDTIFPLDGVERVHVRVRTIYDLLRADKWFGLLITEGPHADTQDLQVPVFHWMNRWLKHDTGPVEGVAEALFTPEELKVFETLPTDQRNTTIHESFVPVRELSLPTTREEWETTKASLQEQLLARCFAAWPAVPPSLDTETSESTAAGGPVKRVAFTSEAGLRPVMDVRTPASDKPVRRVVLTVVESASDAATARESSETVPEGEAWAFLSPRGWGAKTWQETGDAWTHLVRRFILVGTTPDEGRVWDTRRAIAAIHDLYGDDCEIELRGKGTAAGIALYAALFEPSVASLTLEQPPVSHRTGPIFMNVLQVLDMPQAVAMSLPRPVKITSGKGSGWSWTEGVRELYGSGPVVE